MTHASLDPDSLGFLLTDVARLARAAHGRLIESAGLGITAAEARVLIHAARAAGLRQAELAERVGVEPMTLCSHLQRLETAGLITRAPHPEDGRAKCILLTDRARRVIDRLVPLGRALNGDMTAGMSSEEIETLKRSLLAVRARLQSVAPVPVPESAR